MNFSITIRLTRAAIGRGLLATAGLMFTVTVAPAFAESPPTTLQTLIDRAQIEDFIVDYYSDLGGGHQHEFASFYLDDGVLDVNGVVSKGKQAITDLYVKLEQPSSMPRGTFRMLITNPKIVVNGDTATADVIWTGIINDAVKAPPRFVEQGKEHDELVKRNGRWYFKLRVITAYSGLPQMFEKTYKQR